MKKQIAISIDEYIHKSAKELKLNISAVCEQALIKRIHPKKSDIPDKYLKMECSECSKIVDYGYYCELLDKFMCSECNSKFRCLPRDHEHIRIPKLDKE